MKKKQKTVWQIVVIGQRGTNNYDIFRQRQIMKYAMFKDGYSITLMALIMITRQGTDNMALITLEQISQSHLQQYFPKVWTVFREAKGLTVSVDMNSNSMH